MRETPIFHGKNHGFLQIFPQSNDWIGGLNPSEKYDFVSWDYSSQLNGKIKFMFQTTNQIISYYVIAIIIHYIPLLTIIIYYYQYMGTYYYHLVDLRCSLDLIDPQLETSQLRLVDLRIPSSLRLRLRCRCRRRRRGRRGGKRGERQLATEVGSEALLGAATNDQRRLFSNETRGIWPYAPCMVYLYLQNWVIFGANDGKYSIHGAYGFGHKKMGIENRPEVVHHFLDWDGSMG